MSSPAGDAGGRSISLAAGIGLIAAIAVALGTRLLDHSPFEAGVLDTLLRVDHALPLAGLGAALAVASSRQCALGLALAACGIAVGAMLGDRLAPAIEGDAEIASYALLVAPLHCVVVGIALAVPAALRGSARPPAALLSGIVLGLPVISDSASPEQVQFTAGALAAGLSVIAVPLLLLRPFGGPRIAAAARIAGGWLIAIGLLLLALEWTRTPG